MDGYSLDAQKDKLCKYAEYQDMTVAEEFSNEGHSGKNIKGRPEFVRMMEKMAWSMSLFSSYQDSDEMLQIFLTPFRSCRTMV